MHTDCPSCGTRQSAFRIFTWYSGVHARCRSCRALFRVVDSIGGLLAVTVAFGVGYLAGFVAIYDLWLAPPRDDGFAVLQSAAWLLALGPVVPGLVLGFAALGLVARRTREVPVDAASPAPPSALTYAVGYVFATLGTAVLVGVLLLGFLMLRLADPLPPVDSAAGRRAPVAVAVEDAERFVFVATDGVPRSLAGLRGGPVVLHLFAPDGRAHDACLDSLGRLRRDVLGAGVQVVVCALVDEPGWRSFVADTRVKVPFVRPQGGAEVRAPWHTEPVPATYVFDAAGAVVFATTGSQRFDTEAFERYLKELATAASTGR
ncbi:MAG: hypothetical protein IPM29_24705 [Planctomycetes bacterium]|nr:hypothetical protein [Planctomycetota bacterium]